MTKFISLTKQYGDGEPKVRINPTLIEYIEKRIWNGHEHSEVGLFSGKTFEVKETQKEIEELIEKASRFTIMNVKE